MRKPSFKSISFFFIILFLGIYIGLYVSKEYYPSNNDHNFRSIAQNPTPPESDMPVVEVEDQITADTIFIWQSVDLSANTTSEEEIPVPEVYIGLKRESFIDKLEDMKQNPPLTELEKGFTGAQVLEFSPQKILVRAIYKKDEPSDTFFLMVKDNYIVIYYEDKKTVYMNTGIHLETLPDDMQIKIIKGYQIIGEQDLYNFLESYTS